MNLKKLPKRALREIRNIILQFKPRIETTRAYVLGISGNSKPLAGKIAVVTGGSGALGRAIVHRLAAEGATVYALGRNRDRLSEVVSEASTLGGDVHPASVDLADEAALEAFFSGLSGLDILVCSAGGSERNANAPIWKQSMAVIDEVLTSNLRATIATVAAASRRMVEAKSGRIVCLSSVIGDHGKANFSGYAAAKAGITGFVRSAALELGAQGVRINAVSPGQIPRGELDVDQVKWQRSSNVLGEIGAHEDIAEAVSYLVGEGGRFVTGHNLIVDGGRSLGLRGEA